jgi:hypothetical protein
MKFNLKSLIAFSGTISLFVIIVIYIVLNSKNIVRGVVFDIKNPTNGFTTELSYLEFDGTAKNAVKVYVNDVAIPVDQNGNFNETIVLSPGYNILTLSGEDKFGKKTERKFEVYSKKEAYALDNKTEVTDVATNLEKEEASPTEEEKDSTDIISYNNRN